jgi:hypothetical protein
MRFVLAASCAALALAASLAPARAGVPEALDGQILPGFARFETAAAALAAAARADCRAPAVLPAYHAAFDAWMALADLRMGPSETGALGVAFWPDVRGFTPRTLGAMIAAEDPVVNDPAAFAQISIAARGLFALDMMLGDPDLSGYGADSYSCALVQALTDDLAAQAGALNAGWHDNFAPLLRSPGSPGNSTYLTGAEAIRALYTQIVYGLEFTAENRLGRPLGSFERPRPQLAEARRTGRPLRNALLSAETAVALARALAGYPLPATEAALARVQATGQRLSAPDFSDTAEPGARLKLEILQQEIRGLKTAIETEVGVPMGISAGFNAQDGD